MIENDDKQIVGINLNKIFYKEVKKVLFKLGISFPEYFQYLIQLTVIGDPRLQELLIEAKTKSLIKINREELVRHNDESIFSLIEESSPMKG